MKMMKARLMAMKAATKKLLGVVTLTAVSVHAQAQVGGGEGRALEALQDIETWLMGIVPALCTLAIIGAGAGWMFRIVGLEMLGRIAVGAVVIGSASYFSGLFLG